ncbi:hypothetical protein [Cellulosilyticum sp. I15G10I2]|uniref:hypothetical protein n=1 Tax=Cellulosilyticum sp. I15G10I2 TaxID=1892843 RepID=UPI0014957BF9|nr:hypothetical protein [Cellulosilyticum sp. I15G10I2]
MELEIYRFVPDRLIPDDLLNQEFEAFTKLYAKARYMQDIEITNRQDAIVRALGE